VGFRIDDSNACKSLWPGLKSKLEGLDEKGIEYSYEVWGNL
jgi:hypothetical protein